MHTKKFLMILALAVCLMGTPGAAINITWVSNSNTGAFGAPTNNDQGFIDVLTAAGHTVTREIVTAASNPLTPAVKARLEAADMIIMSRTNSSGNYPDLASWNGFTKPLISILPHVVRNDSPRWRWLSTTGNTDAAITNLTAVVPAHPIFDGIALDANNQVSVVTTATSFAPVTTAGNGTILAKRTSDNYIWIVLWEKGVEFYAGSGQFAGGPRMLFCLGEKSASAGTRDGVYNLTDEGKKLFLNAVRFLGPDPTFNPPPSVNAGPDQAFAKPTFPLVVTMNATVTDQDPIQGPAGTLSYTWSFVSGPVTPTISDVAIEDPMMAFTQPGEYTFKLVASDGDKSTEDTMTVYINDTSKDMLMAYWNFESITTENKSILDIAKGNDALWVSDDPNLITRPTRTPVIIPGWVNGSTKAMDFSGAILSHADVTIAATDPNFIDSPRYAATISAWIKVDAFTRAWANVVSKGDDSWRLVRSGRAAPANTNAMMVAFTGPTPGTGFPGNGPAGTISVNDNFWHHVCGTYDGEKIRLYIDGVLDVEGSYTGLINRSNYPVQIAGNAQQVSPAGAVSGRQWDSGLDEIRVYNYALSETDIRALTAQAKTKPYVNAGPDGSFLLKPETSYQLAGVAADYGIPDGMVALWTTVSGPDGAEANFASPSSPTSTVTFTAAGVYTLKLTAYDELTALAPVEDTVVITVTTPSCADVATAGLLMKTDLTGDCVVNIQDLAKMLENWTECVDPEDVNCTWPF